MMMKMGKEKEQGGEERRPNWMAKR